jgi:signal peptidase I
MAETLWGYQKFVTCPSCGHRFPVNASREVEQTRGGVTYIYGCTCPNCRQRITLLRPQDDPIQSPPGTIAIPDPGFVVPEAFPGIVRMFTNGPRSGDRVLVSKYPYDIPGMGPNRLDVVVFKFPGDDHEGIFPDSGPYKNHVPINYIKRLVGMPGETVAIHRGKLFILPPDQSPKYPQDDEARKDPGKAIQMWRSKSMPQEDWLHYNDAQARERFEQQKFQILRKPADIVLSMMRLVYDNDHPAKDLTAPEYQRWVPTRDSSWTEKPDQRAFLNSGGPETTWLRYRHVLRDNPGKSQIITDFMGYNSNQPGERDPSIGENWASDLILECRVQTETAEGKLTLELSRGPSRFQAEFDFASGSCTLYRLQDGMKPQTLGTQPFALSPHGTYDLRFANVDDRLLVWVNHKLPFGEGIEYTPAANLHPTSHNDLDRPGSIGASGGRLTVNHLKLFRDTYYTVNGTSPDMGRDRWGGGNDGFDPVKPATFSNWTKVPFATYYVQPGHYLCLGDNSPESSDGRTWGLVPHRLMLGRAVMVYFPFTRVGRIR